MSTSELTTQQIADLMELYREQDCNDSATALITHYEPIARMAAAKLSRSRPDLYEDLLQVGLMSLLRLFKQFDASKGIPFEGYAMKSLVGHLKNYLRDKSWYIQVPRRIKEKSLLVQRAIDELTVSLGRSPKVDDIAEHLELSVEETIEVLGARESYSYVSLDTPLSADTDSTATVSDIIAAEKDEMQTLIGELDLIEAFASLSEHERFVLELVFMQDQPQREIANQLGISQMSVSRIQRRAIERLKELLQDSDP